MRDRSSTGTKTGGRLRRGPGVRWRQWILRGVLGFACATVFPAGADPSPSEAFEAYRKGNFKGSESQYSELAKNHPDDPRFRFNAGAAAYRNSDLTNATTWFESVLGSQDLKLQQQAYYNLGNARFKLGESQTDAESRRRLWSEALTNFVSAMKLNGADTNASANYAFVRQQLEQLERQMPPPQQRQNQQQPQQNQDKNQDRQQQQQGQPKDNQGQPESSKDQKSSPGSDNPPKGKEDPKDGKKNSPGSEDNSGDGHDSDSGEASKDSGDKYKSGARQQQGEGEQAKGGSKKGESNSGQNQAGRNAEAMGADESTGTKDGEMTAAQAVKMLENQKGDEKALMLRAYGNGKEAAERASRVRKPW